MTPLFYHIGKPSEEEQSALDFADGLSRTVQERIKLGLVPLRLPVIDDAPYRVFDTLAEYRRWATKHLPKWLGYGVDD